MVKQLISAPDAAARLGVSLMTLWRWQRAGRVVPAAQCGRYVFYDPDTLDVATVGTIGERSTSTPGTPLVHKQASAPTVAHKPLHEHEHAISTPPRPQATTAPRARVLSTYDPDLD
jgi:hypothetical protein